MVSGQAKEWKNTFSFRAGGLPLWISPWVPKNKLGNVVASFCVDAMFEINYFRFCKPFTTILGEDLASGENYRPQSHYWQSGTSCSQRALTQEFGPHNSVFELADVVQMPCLLQGACWKEPALQNMVRCYFWLGAWVSQTVFAPLYVQYTVVASLWCEMLDIRPNQSRNILAYHMDVHYHLSCSQS